VAKKAKQLHKDRCITLARGIHRARRALLSHAEDFANGEGLEAAHVSILHALGLVGEMRMSDLAAKVVVGAATLTRRAKQLEERKLVARERSPESQREVLIRLTKQGQALFERSFAHIHGKHRAFFDDRFSPSEQRQLAALFEKL
jgi:DNA-binding MarR family transcriptional regulator